MSAIPDSPEKTIVLCGPAMDPGSEGYGGGKGGYVRNVSALLAHFAIGEVQMSLSPYSTRRYSRWWKLLLPFRLVADLHTFARNIRHGCAVHIMMTYGMAIYREFGMSVIAAAFKRPVILDIRGGGFLQWLESAGRLHRAMAHWALDHARFVLGQGEAVVAHLGPRYGSKVRYFPNFIQSVYWPTTVPDRLAARELAVIFVGYCYAGKGVFELIEGCAGAARGGVTLQLTLIGAESPRSLLRFSTGSRYRTDYESCGVSMLEFDQVQAVLAAQDVFCFPTRHAGEGHPNVITEAMAHAMVIVTTQHGFISELLDDGAAYFIESGSADSVTQKLAYLDTHRDEARRKAHNARAIVQERFTESKVLK